jgi:hypothetical protein
MGRSYGLSLSTARFLAVILAVILAAILSEAKDLAVTARFLAALGMTRKRRDSSLRSE